MSKLWLLLIVSLLLLGQRVSCHKPTNELSAVELGLQEYEVREDVKILARETANRLFGPRQRKVTQFARELVGAYMQTKGKDFAIVYNTGGFGGTSIAADPEWSGVVWGIESELAKLGYNSIVLEHTRSRFGFWGVVTESWDIARNYSGKAPILAAKVEFLTTVEDELRVIITGRSFGAIYSNEVMEHVASNPRAYGIQAGYPFWYRRPSPQNTLVMKDNGVMPDSFNQGDLWAILRANFSHCPSTSRPAGGSIQIGPFFFSTPGHEYTWNHPAVRDRIVAFLEESFVRPK